MYINMVDSSTGNVGSFGTIRFNSLVMEKRKVNDYDKGGDDEDWLSLSFSECEC